VTKNRRCTGKTGRGDTHIPEVVLWGVGVAVAPITPEIYAVLRNHFDGLSAFRPCGHDLAEFFKSTGWALYGNMKGTHS